MSFVAFDTLSKKAKKAVLCHKSECLCTAQPFILYLGIMNSIIITEQV